MTFIPRLGGRAIRRLLLAAVLAATALAVVVPGANAFTEPKDGQWCGFTTPKLLTYSDEAVDALYFNHHYATCDYAYTHFFYETAPSVNRSKISFKLVDRKFVKELKLNDRQRIASADVGFSLDWRASENGFDVTDAYWVANIFATGTIRQGGQTAYFYAFWIGNRN